MMKRLAGLLIFFAIFLVSFSVCCAESGLKLDWGGNTYTIDGDGFTEVSDETAGIDAAIKVETLDEDNFSTLRAYYNDIKSTEDQLFEKYVKLQRSYISAEQDLFRSGFLYGDQDDQSSESNLKLFHDGSDIIFGQNSAVYMYNTFKSVGLDFNEETHLDLSIPFKEKHSLISIGIAVKCGSLNESSIGKITALLNAVRIERLMPQKSKLLIFGDKDVINAANEGSYPNVNDKDGKLISLKDDQAGFSLSYPSGYVPYMQNSIGGNLQYWSFKINPNHIFSVSAAPLAADGSPETAVKAIVEVKGKDSVTEEGKQEIKGRSFNYVNYETTTTEGAIYVSEYFTADSSKLYCLQFSSRFEKPSPQMLGDFGRILESFSTMKPTNEALTTDLVTERYINKEEGYSFSYPKDWELRDVSDNISFDRLKLMFPGLSGPLDITVSEGEQQQSFDGSPMRLLNQSFRHEGSYVYSYRLLDYLDSNERNKLAYCIDIFKGKKVYSMLIAVGEYEAADGRLKDTTMNSIINAIASSFRIDDTVESSIRVAAGETRNRKIVFIEDWMKTNIDPKLKVTEVEKTAADGSIYVKVAAGENGYYRVKPDFEKGGLKILDFMFNITILKSELEKLKDGYKDRIITGTMINIPTSAITIESQADISSPILARTYRVDISCTENGIRWETVRANHAEELRNECRSYLSFIFSADINMQFSQADAFKDIESCRQNKMKCDALVHLQFNSIDGFFILEVDPENDKIRPVSFKPMDLVLKEIDEKYGYGKNGFEITESSFNSESFVLSLTLGSKADGALKFESVKVLYNQKDKTVDYSKL